MASIRDRSSPELLLVHGEERFLVDEEVRSWRQRSDADQLGIEVIDPPAPIERIRVSLAEMAFLDPRRYVLIRDAPQLGGGRRSGDGGRALAAALELRAPTTSVCLVSHQKVAAGHPVLDAVPRLGGQVRLFNPLKGREVRQWAERAAMERGLRLRTGGLDHLLRVAGTDLGVISRELDKLGAYAQGDVVDLDAVRKLVAGNEGVEVWNVLERLLGSDPGRGVAAIELLLDEGRSTQYLIATLGGQLRELLQAQTALRTTGPGTRLAMVLKIPEWRAERLARQAVAVPPELVEEWLRRLQRADAAIKNGEADDAQTLRGFALSAARELLAARTSRAASA